MSIELIPLGSALGMEVRGVDLTQDLDEDTLTQLQDAWRKHLVLLFRNQRLNHEQHIRFSRGFGDLDSHESLVRLRHPEYPEILPVKATQIDGRKLVYGQEWHSDMSHTLNPSKGSLLRSELIPPAGGDTMFGNMYLAYETLSETMKRIVDDLWAVHDLRVGKHNRGQDLTAIRNRNPPVAHPLVRVHPETGRKSLFVSEMETEEIIGMTREEAAPLLQFLFAHASRPEFIYRHRWAQHDLLLWDNRCTIHVALQDYGDHPRSMFRTTLLGESSGYVLEKDL